MVLEFTWYMRRLKDKDGYKRLKQRGESLKKDYYAVKKEYKLMRRMGGAAFIKTPERVFFLWRGRCFSQDIVFLCSS